MSYESRFGANIEEIFEHCGYSSNEAMAYWPTDATAEGVAIGREHGLEAPEAAMVEFCQTLLANCEMGRLTRSKARKDLDSLVHWTSVHYPEFLARAVSTTIKTQERMLVMPTGEVTSPAWASSSY